jgi:hypothetical protein
LFGQATGWYDEWKLRKEALYRRKTPPFPVLPAQIGLIHKQALPGSKAKAFCMDLSPCKRNQQLRRLIDFPLGKGIRKKADLLF